MSLAMSHQRDVHRRSVRPAAANTEHSTVHLRALVVTGVVAAGVLVASLVADRALWPYAATVALVSFAAVLVVNRDSSPTPVQGTQLAVAGERRTASILEPLHRSGWSVTHGIRRHRLNVDFTIDHLVIGPNGPFAMQTKTVSGTVRISRGLVSITPPGASLPEFPSDSWAYQARSLAAEAYQLLKERTGTAMSVRAVVVIWGTFPQRCVSGHNVTFVHGDELAGWLLAQPSRLTAAEVSQLDVARHPAYEMPASA